MARQFDQSCVVHAIWLRLAVLRTAMWVTRVASKDNIADDPSRYQQYALVHVHYELFLCQGILWSASSDEGRVCAGCAARFFLESIGLGVFVDLGQCVLVYSAAMPRQRFRSWIDKSANLSMCAITYTLSCSIGLLFKPLQSLMLCCACNEYVLDKTVFASEAHAYNTTWRVNLLLFLFGLTR